MKAAGVVDKQLTTELMSKDLDKILSQTGAQSIIYAYQKNDAFLDNMCNLLLLFGKYNAVELFTQKLQMLVPSWTDYAHVCNDLFKQTINSKMGMEMIE